MGKRKTFFGSFLSVFNPLSLDGLSLYLNRNTNVNSRIAQYLDGSTDALNMDTLVGDLASTTTGIWAGWVKPVDATPSGTEYLVAFGDTNAESRISLHIETSGALRLVLEITGTNNIIMTTDSAFFTLSGVGVHVGIVQDATSIKMYKNAVLVASTDIGTGTGAEWFNDVSGLDNARIGCINFNSVGDILFLNTDVDEWGFWDNDTAVTISSLYNGGDGKSYEDLTTAEKVGLAGYYRLDDYLDSSGNSNTLTAIGTPTDVVGMVNAPSLIGESVYSWLDQGPLALDFIQATASSQPVVNDFAVTFDGVNDILTKNLVNPFVGDSSGIFFFSGYYDDLAQNLSFSLSDDSSNIEVLYITVRLDKIAISSRGTDNVNDLIESTDSVINGEYYYGWIKSTGTSFELSLNGVTQSAVVVAGTNSGDWMNDLPNADRININGLDRTSMFYGAGGINKVIYSNAALSAGDITATETFMAAPLDPAFNPLNITGLQLYLNVDNATPSSWLDQSPNAYDFVQGTASNQPVVNPKSVDFDNSNDNLRKGISDAYIADSSGYIFFCGYFDNTATNRVFSSSDEAGINNLFQVGVNSTGEISVVAKEGSGGTLDHITSTNTITNGSYYYGYVRSSGTAWYINLNGVNEVVIIAGGSNRGLFFSDIPLRDNLAIGALIRTSTISSPSKVNKVIYSNAALSAGEITSILGFISSPHT